MRVGTSEIKLRAAFRITEFTKRVHTEGGETGCGVIHGGDEAIRHGMEVEINASNTGRMRC